MTPYPTALLGLVLCLGPTIPAQTAHVQHRRGDPEPSASARGPRRPRRGMLEARRAGSELLPTAPSLSPRHLHRPSISAKPGPVVRRGSSVTFVCRGPSSVDTFRLEKERGPFNETMFEKESHHNETEAIFPIASASEHHAGRYRCIYLKRSVWSERSEFLELKVTDEGTTQGPPTSQALPSDTPGPSGLQSEHLYILVGVSVAFLLCVLLLGLFLLHRQRRGKRRTPSSESEEQKPQERLSPGVDALQRAPGAAAEERLPEDREAGPPAPAAGDPQEVMYAQLNHQTLTQGAARAVSPQPTGPPAESSTYAAISRR
ncbi:leukocyte-associated immunoglobulin-like receptor 1 isoform X2 [Choloepus didactylus]|uniref:leukocyte-associated immunoglobulin-like receptor 1 isoform X2 n=1 Tax=Choloepus didactylus TaxID=27675 RepID=UPI00189FBAE3|nr:leukocyte-associated immunoglobulin-like receptor 1 isoform X2 [Choloepus didactylus]